MQNEMKREGESWFKKYTSKKYYQVLQKTTRIEILPDVGDFRLFAVNDKVDQERMAYIDQSIGKKEKTLTLTKLPFEKFLWMSTPDISGFHYSAFKEYHDIPAQAEIKIISYKEWEKEKVKELSVTSSE